MFKDYQPKKGYDEYFSSDDFLPRSTLEPLLSSLGEMGLDQLNISHEIARKLLLRHGATFRLNDSGNKGSERILPFDPLPRVVALASSSMSELVAPVRGSFVGPSKLKSELNWNIEIT